MAADLDYREGETLLRVNYIAAPVVRDFVEDPTPLTGIFGPLGSSKTTGGAMKVYSYAYTYPGARIAIIRDTWPNLRDTTMRTFFEWFPEGVAGDYHKTDKVFTLRTGTDKPAEVWFRAMDRQDDVKNVLSLELAAAWIDEPQGGLAPRLAGRSLVHEPGIDHRLFQALYARVGRQTGYPKMIWMSGNPPAPSHWIGKEFRYAGRGVPNNPRPGWHLYLTDQETNRAHLPPRYYEDLADLYGEGTPMARRFLQGEWIDFAVLNPFRAEWITYYERRPDPKDLYLVLGVDPAISGKDEASRTAVVLVGRPLRGVDKGTALVLEALAGHWSPYEQAAQIIRLCEKYPTMRRVRIEAVAWQRALKDIVEREARLKGVRLPFVEPDVHPKGDKLLRASRWSGLVEGGYVQFGRECGDLVASMLAVPMDPSGWDLVDATGLALEGLPTARPEASPITEPKRQEMARARSYVAPPTDAMPTRPVPRVIGPNPYRPWAGPLQARRRARGYAVRTGGRDERPHGGL